MSTYDFEPNPDDYGPEPAHIANPRKALINAAEKLRVQAATHKKSLSVQAEPVAFIVASICALRVVMLASLSRLRLP